MGENRERDGVFQALAHPVRRRILDIVRDRPGANVGAVCDGFAMSRIGVLKHIRALEAADLLISERAGRERHLYFNVVPIQMIYDRWTSDYGRLWAGHLARVKYRVETEEEP
jgi:DNA-binding transcriptional ArsR family regulator